MNTNQVQESSCLIRRLDVRILNFVCPSSSKISVVRETMCMQHTNIEEMVTINGLVFRLNEGSGVRARV
jgi:hypothetical protein